MTIINSEWLNQNSLRNYPLREDVSRSPIDDDGNAVGSFRLPNYVIVDFVLSVPSEADVGSVYLGLVLKAAGLFTLAFNAEDGTRIATVSVDLSTHAENQVYRFYGVDPYDDCRGSVVVGDLSSLADDMPDGVYRFSAATAALEAVTLVPDVRGVRSFRIDDMDNVSERIYGDITLRAGNNIRLLRSVSGDETTILIHAVSGDNMEDQCACTKFAGNTNVVRRVNGYPIEDVVINGGDCVTVGASGTTLTVSDTCSKPCCGCPELEAITAALRNLELSIRNIQSSVDQLNTYVTEFVQNVVMTVTG